MKHLSEMQHSLELFLENNQENSLHASEIAFILKKIRKRDHDEFLTTLRKIPQEVLGEVLLELPEKVKDEAIEFLSSHELASAIESLDSDDATNLVKDIDDVDEDKSEEVIGHLDEEDREDIDKLRHYEDDQAGAWMQIELFDATLDETVQHSIDRLKELKASDELENIYQVFIINEQQRLIATVALEDMILFDFSKTYRDLLDTREFRSVEASADIQEVASMFEQFDLSVLPVVDWQGRLVGRITSDDIYDVIEERATEQIYNLAGVDDEMEQEDKAFGVAQKRGVWLGVNLVTAVFASIVISMFESTLAAYIPLAILMPIVASMGGNAGLQALTVMVRRIALGEIDFTNARDAILREVSVVLINGTIFATIIGLVAGIWFHSYILSIVIGCSMIINLFVAGFVGAVVPLLMKRLQIDPAVGSSVILTMTTDIIGFFTFLGLASIFLV